MTKVREREVGIIDDDSGVRDSLRFLLEVMGYPVATFASAGEFLVADPTHFACLIMDHHMPNMTGLDLVERLRARGNVIPILLITGSSSPAILARAAELGIHGVLEKPPGDDELLDFVNAHR